MTDEARTYTLRDAAELCGVELASLRKRADRGTLRTVKLDGVRHVPHSELERLGLLPDARVRELEAELAQARTNLAEVRQITERAEGALEAEAKAHDLTRAELHEQRAAAATARLRAEELEALEAELAGAGPIRAWRIARARRRATPPGQDDPDRGTPD